MDSAPKKLQRRQFLTKSAASVGAMATSTVAANCFANDLRQQQDKGRGQEKTQGDGKIVSLKDAHKGSVEIDLRIMNQYQDQTRELQDFYLACREALTSKSAMKSQSTDLSKVCREHGQKKLGGPMLGDVGTHGVSVWMHLPTDEIVKVIVTSKGSDLAQSYQSDGNAITSVRCEGLAPNTLYSYTVYNANSDDLGSGQFTTAPMKLTQETFRIAFGADFHKVGMYQPALMKLIQERAARAMLLIGDSAVDGRKDNWGLINTDYMLRNLSTPIRELVANVPVSATWDDHDYWGNDISGTTTGKKNPKPIDVDGLRRMWKTQWNNPQRDLDRAGIYFETHIGPIHYIATDTRSCRVNDQRGKRNCFLGEEQMDWLEQTLAASTSPFILISGGTMWTDYISAGKDSWGKWDIEGREAIFSWIDQKKDSQVCLLSGDRHGARGFKLPREGARDIYEFEIGTLGGVPGPEAFGKDRSAQLFGMPSRSFAFGELTFGLSDGKPQAEFRLIDHNGTIQETVTVR